MFANPFDATVAYADFRWTGLFLGFIPINAPTADAVGANVVTGVVHYWNGNTYGTRSWDGVDSELGGAALFAPYESAWIEYLVGLAPLIGNLTVHAPDPTP